MLTKNLEVLGGGRKPHGVGKPQSYLTLGISVLARTDITEQPDTSVDAMPGIVLRIITEQGSVLQHLVADVSNRN